MKDLEPMSAAVGEFLFVLQFLLEEWGDQNMMILAPEEWKTTMCDIGIPVHFATDKTITVIVDCSDRYILYHMPASALSEPFTSILSEPIS